MKENYRILGVDENASDEEIEKAYKALKAKYREERFMDGEAGNAAAKKLTAGELGEGFVRLFPPSSILCLAEGIETALSVHETEGVPVWSVISVGGYERFRTLPEGLRELRVYADNDRSFAGIAGAYELARRLKREHPTLVVKVFEPEREGEDWNDVLRRREERGAPK